MNQEKMSLVGLKAQAKFEKQWKENPKQYFHRLHPLEKERIEKSWELLNTHFEWEGKKVADLGCGEGEIAIRAAQKGAEVTASDVSTLALKEVERKKGSLPIKLKHATLPQTPLPDAFYDLVVCFDVISDIPKKGQRLFFSELSRLITDTGRVAVSTKLAIDTLDPLAHFLGLLKTEFEIEYLDLSHHFLFVKGLKLLTRLEKLKGGRIFSPLKKRWLNWEKGRKFLETVSRETWDEEGATHVIVIAKRRPLF